MSAWRIQSKAYPLNNRVNIRLIDFTIPTDLKCAFTAGDCVAILRFQRIHVAD